MDSYAAQMILHLFLSLVVVCIYITFYLLIAGAILVLVVKGYGYLQKQSIISKYKSLCAYEKHVEQERIVEEGRERCIDEVIEEHFRTTRPKRILSDEEIDSLLWSDYFRFPSKDD